MTPSRYDAVAAAFVVAGLIIWLVHRSDPYEAILWRDVAWIIGVGIGAYGAGRRRGPTANDR